MIDELTIEKIDPKVLITKKISIYDHIIKRHEQKIAILHSEIKPLRKKRKKLVRRLEEIGGKNGV